MTNDKVVINIAINLLNDKWCDDRTVCRKSVCVQKSQRSKVKVVTTLTRRSLAQSQSTYNTFF